MPGYPATAYASDEDLAIRAAADFVQLCPADQCVARGVDGAFSAQSPWTLSSATVDFDAFGVAPGMLAVVTLPRGASGSFDEQLVVGSVAPGAITLRRKGQAAGVGQPPGLGGATGRKFAVLSMLPQLIRASYDLNRRFGVDDLVLGRRKADLYDAAELVHATALTVLAWQYPAQAGDARDGKDDGFRGKGRLAGKELDDLLARVALHWLPTDPGAIDQPTASVRVARLRRG